MVFTSTRSEVDDVTVFNNVLLTLLHQLTVGLDSSLITQLNEVLVLGDLGQNEGVHEIVVDNTGSLGSLGTLTDGPFSDLISTTGEVRAEMKGTTHGGNDLGESGLDTQLLELLLTLLVGLHVGETLLEADREGDDKITGGVGINPLLNAQKMLVLLADVVTLREVDKVDAGLGSKQEHGVDDLDLLGGPGTVGNTLTLLKVLDQTVNESSLILLVLDLKRLATTLDNLLNTLQVLLGKLDILDSQLVENNL